MTLGYYLPLRSSLARRAQQTLFFCICVVAGNCPRAEALNLQSVTIQSGPQFSNNTRSVDTADFNRDGKMDVLIPAFVVPATETAPSWTGVSVWLRTSKNGNQAVTYAAAQVFPGSLTGALGSTIVDLNYDNFPDVAIYSRTAKKVAIFLNAGNTPAGAWAGLSLHSQVNVDLGSYPVGFGPSRIRHHDFNGDGHPDLVIGNYAAAGGSSQTDFAILLNLGISVTTGDFNGFHTPYPVMTGNTPRGSVTDFSITDLNGDGISEIAALQWIGSTTIPTTVSISTFNQDFSISVQTVTVHAPSTSGSDMYMAVGDVDNDNRPDVITLRYNGAANPNHSVYILKNLQNAPNGQVIFGSPNQITLPTGGDVPRGLALEDMDGDGDREIIFSYGLNAGGKIGILTNNGSGFDVAQFFDTGGAYTFGFKVADLSGEGRLDVVSANMGVGGPGSVTALINKPPMLLAPSAAQSTKASITP